jgi:hypothetical protein
MTISYYLAPIHVFHDAGSSIDNTYAIDYIFAVVIGAYSLAMAEAFYIYISYPYKKNRKMIGSLSLCGLNRQDIPWFFTFLAN